MSPSEIIEDCINAGFSAKRTCLRLRTQGYILPLSTVRSILACMQTMEAKAA